MKVIRTFCLSWLLMLAGGVSAQLVDKVLSVLGEDSVGSVTVAGTDSDSIQLSLVRRELETARLNEANLRMEMEQMKLAGYAADSVKLALQKQRIDSLRTVTPGIPVVVEKDTLFYLYAKRGGHTPQQRAKDVSSRPLKSAHLRNIVRKQYPADFFNKPQKSPHGSFEVVCGGS